MSSIETRYINLGSISGSGNSLRDTLGSYFEFSNHENNVQANFQTLSDLEKKQGFREKGEGKFFFRKGEIGDWKRVLTKKQTNKIENAFSKEMVNLGYLKV